VPEMKSQLIGPGDTDEEQQTSDTYDADWWKDEDGGTGYVDNDGEWQINDGLEWA